MRLKWAAGAILCGFLTINAQAQKPKRAVIAAKGPLCASVKQKGASAISGSSIRPQVSGDGRLVVFESLAALTADDKNRTRDIYLFNRETNKLVRLEAGDPTRSNGGPSISRSGQMLAFHSYPLDVVKGKAPRSSDIIIYNLMNGKQYLITSGLQDRPHNGEALYPILNMDGRRVVFTSNDTNLVVEKDQPVRSVYLFDWTKFDMTMVSQSLKGEPANRPSADPKISDDGDIIVYRSAATNLVGNQPVESLSYHLYWLDQPRARQYRIDEFEKGFDDNEWTAGAFDMDAKGDVVVFDARHRFPGQPIKALALTDLFIYERSTATVKLVTTGIFASRSRQPTISGDGRFVAFVFSGVAEDKKDKGGLVIHDRARDMWKRVVMGKCANPTLSADGRVLAYELEDTMKKPSRKVTNVYVVMNPFLEEPIAGH